MARERSYQTEAVILRRRNMGEADRILTLFTPHRGKIRVRAVGARKPGSRKSGHVELFTRVNLCLARAREIDIVTQAETVEAFTALREDLLRSASATYLVDLLDRLAPEEAENPPAYRLLTAALEELCRTDAPALVLRCYEVKLLEEMGYRPELGRCTVGGEEIRAEAQYFSPQRGGAVCPHCGPDAEGAAPISLAALRILRHIQRVPLAEGFALRVSPATLEELKAALHRYVQYVVESPLRSRPYLEEVSRPRGEGKV